MFGSIISTVGDLVGAKMNKKSADKATNANLAMNAENIQLQKDFARHGIGWKVADAKESGIHPLYALGAQTHSFSPSSIGVQADTSMGDAIARSGQDIGRAVSANSNELQRLQLRLLQSQVEGQEIDNAAKASQIARNSTTSAQVPPSFPTGGSVPPDFYKRLPQPLGTGSAHPLHKIVIDEKGNPLRVYNDEAGDNDWAMLGHTLAYTVPDWIHGRITKPGSRYLKKLGKRFSDYYNY